MVQLICFKYSGREIVGLKDKINANITAHVKLIESSYLSATTETKAFDLAQKIKYLTADSIGNIAFSEPIGFYGPRTTRTTISDIGRGIPLLQHIKLVSLAHAYYCVRLC